MRPNRQYRRHLHQLRQLSSLLSLITSLEHTMPSSRRNTLIRTIATITGDIAAGVAMASVAVWMIETAALGLFLSFLIWLLAAIASLVLSQYVVHPVITAVMSDTKLDLAVDAITDLAQRLALFTGALQQHMRSA